MTQGKNFNTRNMILCALFAALIAVGAFIKIPIPVVPFTLQFLFTNLAGLLLGKRYGAISVGVYIAVGLLGLPVFTNGGGIGYIFQPTFGYIIGFMAGTWLTGYIAEKSQIPTFKRLLLAGFAGLVIVYLLGMLYYYIIANYYMNSPLGVWSLILYCFILAVPGDIIICFASAILAKRLIPIMKRG
ncbi:biotin transporter BioY [Bacillota bacterium LX-D]|nr:biotin transporter BioY [Bacillota bacterium LX-D]